MRSCFVSALAWFLFLTSVPGLAQTPTPAPAAQDDDVVRITTNLIQLDVTVTDKEGHLVPDLKAEDFEILENNKTQKISNFSYVVTQAASATEPVKPTAAAKNAPPPPPGPPLSLRPEQVRRTFALVVDDLGLSFESAHSVRQALRKFLDNTMQPGDLVAILRTSSGVGALQQFTSDKRQLLAAIERVRWTPMGRAGISAFAPLQGAASAPKTGNSPDDSSDEDTNVDLLREQNYVVGTLGALRYVVNGLRDLPGRKSVVLFSDGFALFTPGGADNTRVRDNLRKLTDLANRSSVVIYTMDARGVPITDVTAADDTSGLSARDLSAARTSRSGQIFDTQTGLIQLAKSTGGFAIYNENDLGGGLNRIAADQNGYYLIGYQPDESTFDARRLRYNDIKVKLNRPGLNIRYRTGFYGVTDERTREKPKLTPSQAMIAALVSPFNVAETQLQLTTIFGNDASAGSYMRSYLHIRAQDLTFTNEPDGSHKAEFDLIALTFGDNGAAIDTISKTVSMQLRDVRYENALKGGFIYTATVPIKKAGAYQLRVAVRDTTSGRIGSASQFIEVPDINKDRLMLSGLAAFGQKPEDVNRPTAGDADSASTLTPEEDPEAGAATRRLRKGMIIQYGCYIYNARLDSASKRPQLTTQLRLFRDGQEVFHGDELPYHGPYGMDMRRLPLLGAMQLGTAMPAGDYVLQVVVTDALAKEKNRIATQWIDFEILP
jgi:VWFA-related protein